MKIIAVYADEKNNGLAVRVYMDNEVLGRIKFVPRLTDGDLMYDSMVGFAAFPGQREFCQPILFQFQYYLN